MHAVRNGYFVVMVILIFNVGFVWRWQPYGALVMWCINVACLLALVILTAKRKR